MLHSTFILWAWAHAGHGYPLWKDLPLIIEKCILWSETLSSVLDPDRKKQLFQTFATEIDTDFQNLVDTLDRKIFEKVRQEYNAWYIDETTWENQSFQTIDQYIWKQDYDNVSPELAQIKRAIIVWLFAILDKYAEQIEWGEDRYYRVFGRILQTLSQWGTSNSFDIKIITFNYDYLTEIRIKQFAQKIQRNDRKSLFLRHFWDNNRIDNVYHVHWFRTDIHEVILSPEQLVISPFINRYWHLHPSTIAHTQIFWLWFGFHQSIYSNILESIGTGWRRQWIDQRNSYWMNNTPIYVNNKQQDHDRVINFFPQNNIQYTSDHADHRDLKKIIENNFHIFPNDSRNIRNKLHNKFDDYFLL